MAEATKIQWTQKTASPWHGCSEVHIGCDQCYARTMAKRNPATLGVWGPNGTRVRSASFWDNCRRWNRAAEKAGRVDSVFPSICDPFENWGGKILNAKGETGFSCAQCGTRWFGEYQNDPTKPSTRCLNESCRAFGFELLLTMNDLRRDLFALIDECQSLRFLLLTKRPENVRRMWPETTGVGDFRGSGEVCTRSLYRPNVWLLTSVSDQTTADAMLPHLIQCRGLVPILGVSAEPLLGEVRLQHWLGESGIRWVIIGGESGPHARPCHVEWVRSLARQCKAASVPAFVKQLGAVPLCRFDSDDTGIHGFDACDFVDVGDGIVRPLGLDSKGGDPDQWPEDLRTRDFPEVAR